CLEHLISNLGGRVRIPCGAPLSTHLRTPSLTVLAGHDSLFKYVLAALDSDLLVVNLDDIDECPHVGLPERHSSRGEVLLHYAAKTLDERGINRDLRRRLLFGAFEGSLCPITTGFKGIQPVLENFIQVRQFVLDQP